MISAHMMPSITHMALTAITPTAPSTVAKPEDIAHFEHALTPDQGLEDGGISGQTWPQSNIGGFGDQNNITATSGIDQVGGQSSPTMDFASRMNISDGPQSIKLSKIHPGPAAKSLHQSNVEHSVATQSNPTSSSPSAIKALKLEQGMQMFSTQEQYLSKLTKVLSQDLKNMFHMK